MDMTADGEWLLVVPYRGNYFYVYRYDYSINDFQRFQTIYIYDTNNNYNEAAAITDDHQWLILTKNGGRVHVYTFNGT